MKKAFSLVKKLYPDSEKSNVLAEICMLYAKKLMKYQTTYIYQGGELFVSKNIATVNDFPITYSSDSDYGKVAISKTEILESLKFRFSDDSVKQVSLEQPLYLVNWNNINPQKEDFHDFLKMFVNHYSDKL